MSESRKASELPEIGKISPEIFAAERLARREAFPVSRDGPDPGIQLVIVRHGTLPAVQRRVCGGNV